MAKSTAMNAVRDVAASYRRSLRYIKPFLLIHLVVRLLAAAVIVPVSGLLLSAALGATGQSAVTDQDIARFLLSPFGFAGAIALVALSVVASVLDIAVMTDTLRRRDHRGLGALYASIRLFIARFIGLFTFGAMLALRVLLMSAPFLAVGGVVAWLTLSRYDINYYLTYWPPAFLITAVIGGILLTGLAGLLVARLSGWAIALHLVLFSKVSPHNSFPESTRKLRGRRIGVVLRILAWAGLRTLLTAVLAGGASLLIAGVQHLVGPNLRLVALSTIVFLLLWWVANAVLSALANGALATLLDDVYRDVTGQAPDAHQTAGASAPGRGKRALPLVLGLPMILIAGGLALSGEQLENVAADRTVEIIAHRGAAGSRPENTLASVEQALVEGADWVEIDVQETADNEVVVAHDSDFMKLARVDLKVWDATMTDIADIDIGSWFDAAYADERTPTLRDVLTLAKGRGKVLIELKYYGHDVALEARVADIVDETGMSEDVGVMSLKIPGVEKMHALRPDWPYGILAATALGDLSALDADFLAVNSGQASLGLVRRVHDQGKKLYVWTVDDPLTMVRMISLGVDGLITNEPALARAVMDQRNELSAFERLLLWMSDRFRPKSFDLVAEETDA